MVDFYLKTKATMELELPVYKKLVQGSTPFCPLDLLTVIPRAGVPADIKDIFSQKQQT